MKTSTIKSIHAHCGLISGLLSLAAITTTAHANGVIAGPITYTTDNFGSGGNAFSIQFADVGNAGNGDDATGFTYTADGGNYGSGTTFGLGGVAYNYRIGVTEVPQDWITKATAISPNGLTDVTAGAWGASQPAANMRWVEAAAFVNWLNTSTGHQAAYKMEFTEGWEFSLWESAQAWQVGGENLYRHKDAYYFLPSEDEWYKAAYHRNDGATGTYWDYATGSNTAPTVVTSGTSVGTAVYGDSLGSPAAVNDNGGLSAYGTRGQNGNVSEWQEGAYDGTNDDSYEDRAYRGGYWGNPEGDLRSSSRGSSYPYNQIDSVGFRVASVPEPSSALLMLGSGLILLAKRRRERSL